MIFDNAYFSLDCPTPRRRRHMGWQYYIHWLCFLAQIYAPSLWVMHECATFKTCFGVTHRMWYCMCNGCAWLYVCVFVCYRVWLMWIKCIDRGRVLLRGMKTCPLHVCLCVRWCVPWTWVKGWHIFGVWTRLRAAAHIVCVCSVSVVCVNMSRGHGRDCYKCWFHPLSWGLSVSRSMRLTGKINAQPTRARTSTRWAAYPGQTTNQKQLVWRQRVDRTRASRVLCSLNININAIVSQSLTQTQFTCVSVTRFFLLLSQPICTDRSQSDSLKLLLWIYN